MPPAERSQLQNDLDSLPYVSGQKIWQMAFNVNKCKVMHTGTININYGLLYSKGMWGAVRELTGRKQQDKTVDGVTGTYLNQHYAAISTDASYTPPPLKHITSLPRGTQS